MSILTKISAQIVALIKEGKSHGFVALVYNLVHFVEILWKIWIIFEYIFQKI